MCACNTIHTQSFVDIEKLPYEQQLPLWLSKFKKYPEEAKVIGLSGTGDLFIQIDRKGNIVNYKILKSTGHKILDDALLQMVKDAKQVPAVPEDYHANKKVFNYRISFSFGDDQILRKYN